MSTYTSGSAEQAAHDDGYDDAHVVVSPESWDVLTTAAMLHEIHRADLYADMGTDPEAVRVAYASGWATAVQQITGRAMASQLVTS